QGSPIITGPSTPPNSQICEFGGVDGPVMIGEPCLSISHWACDASTYQRHVLFRLICEISGDQRIEVLERIDLVAFDRRSAYHAICTKPEAAIGSA
ncbi:MAG: hypothetical protein AAFQ04_02605, partial [Pseudomonadota bacterium]